MEEKDRETMKRKKKENWYNTRGYELREPYFPTSKNKLRAEEKTAKKSKQYQPENKSSEEDGK